MVVFGEGVVLDGADVDIEDGFVNNLVVDGVGSVVVDVVIV